MVLDVEQILDNQANLDLVKKWSNISRKQFKSMGLTESLFAKGSEHEDFLRFVPNGNSPEGRWRKYVVARLLENQIQADAGRLKGLNEATMSHAVGGYEKFVFPTIIAVFANLLIDQLVSVQPLTAPSGMIFFMDIVAGSSKGQTAQGSKLYNATLGPIPTSNYTSEQVTNEGGPSTNGSTTNFSYNLSYIPVRPGTVTLTAVTGAGTTMTVNDDGQGNLVGNVGAASTVNYQTGAVNVTWSTAPASGTAANFGSTYEYISEGNNNRPQLDVRLSSTTVVARNWSITTDWSVEAAQDLQQLHGMSLEKIILDYTNNRIQQDIQNSIIGQLLIQASAGTLSWSRTPPSGVQYYFHKQQIRDTISLAKASIRQATRRFMPNWCICDPQFAAVLRVVEGFTNKPVPANIGGIYEIGSIDGLRVYENPDMNFLPYNRTADNVGLAILGHKGDNFIEAGFVFAPYLGIYATSTYTLQDMVQRKGIMYRAGLKMIESAQYAVINMTSTPNVPETPA